MKKLMKAIIVTLFISLFYVVYAEAFSFFPSLSQKDSKNSEEKLAESKQDPLQNMREDIVFQFLRKNEALAMFASIWLKYDEDREKKLAELPYRSLYHKLWSQGRALFKNIGPADRDLNDLTQAERKMLKEGEHIGKMWNNAKNVKDFQAGHEAFNQLLLREFPAITAIYFIYMYEILFEALFDVQRTLEKLVPEFDVVELNIMEKRAYSSFSKSVSRILCFLQKIPVRPCSFLPYSEFWCYLQDNLELLPCSMFIPYSERRLSNSGLTENEFQDLVRAVYYDELEEYKRFVATNKNILDEISEFANQKFIIKTIAEKCIRSDEKEYCISNIEEHEIKSLLEIVPYIRSIGSKHPVKASKQDL